MGEMHWKWNKIKNKIIITHAAHSQPEHRILVRRMGLETQWKTSWNTAVFEMDANFLNLHIEKARKTQNMTMNNFIYNYILTQLFTAHVKCNGTVI